jgi:cyclopropane fatty-acyl-phospholipid synthase-like methyltransferase
MSTTTTTITGDDFRWIVECLEIQADHLEADADHYARTARDAEARLGHPHKELEQAATVKREEADRTWRLYELVAAGASITIHGEQA